MYILSSIKHKDKKYNRLSACDESRIIGREYRVWPIQGYFTGLL